MVKTTKVEGEKDERKVFLYAISTCGWCKKVKKLLEEMEIEYEYVNIDKVSGWSNQGVMNELKQYNEKATCPTLVIDEGEEVIIGYQEDKIKEVLGDEK